MRIRNTLASVILIVVLGAAGYAAQWLTLLGWNAVVKYPSPFARALPFGERGPVLAGRVVIVVVDGLRADSSERMPVLNSLRAMGAAFTAWTGEPSLSLPGWTAIVSGAGPEVSGVTTNWYEGAARVDHLFGAAKRAGISTAVAGSPSWSELFGPALDEQVLVGDPPGTAPIGALYRTSVEVAAGTADILRRGQARLVLVHFPSVDLVGHRHGGASAEYAESVRRVDEHLGALVRALDLSRDTLIITSDHGHLDAGGHGGWEPIVKRVPLVFAGRSVRPGAHPAEVRQVDIAPTVAVLLGIPIPSHNQGRPLAEALRAESAVINGRWIAQQRTFFAAQAGILETRTPPRTAAEFSMARDARLARERSRRLPSAVAAALLPLIGVIWLVRRRLFAPASVGAAAFFLIDYGLFFGRGYSFSLSVFNSEQQILAFFNQRLTDAALAIAAGALIAGALAARRRPSDAFLGALGAGLLTAYAILLQVAYFYWQWDVRFAWYLPDLRLGFKYYLDLLMLVPVGFLAALYGVVGLLGRWIAKVALRSRHLAS